MKKGIITVVAISLSFAFNVAQAQSDEIQQLLLNVEKLTQFKQILSDMKKGYDVISVGYNSVKDISQGNFSLHKSFLDGLMEVSPAVKKYRKVADIISLEVRLVREYKLALKRFQQDKNFNTGELNYISGVYTNLIKKSLENIDELTTVITSSKLRMSDDERLKSIDSIHHDMEVKLAFLNHFNNSTSALALQRRKSRNDLKSMGSIYGINN